MAVQTALALQLQPADLTVELQTLMTSLDVVPQGSLGLAGVGTVPHQAPVGLQLVGVPDVLPQSPGVGGLELAPSHGAFKSLPFELVIGDYVFVESALGGTFVITLSAVHSDLEMFEIFMFLQHPGPGGGEAADVTAVQHVLMGCREMSLQGALV